MDGFRDKLLAMKGALAAAEADSAGDEAPVELDQARMGRLSRMDALQIQAMSKETGRRRRQLLRDVDLALERMDRGEYGLCRECGEAIAEARLEIQPTARLCIDCAAAQE
ncbi:MAG: TraR/DksA family transcriptional regulator [Gammaproteobacteria bacterium]